MHKAGYSPGQISRHVEQPAKVISSELLARGYQPHESRRPKAEEGPTRPRNGEIVARTPDTPPFHAILDALKVSTDPRNGGYIYRGRRVTVQEIVEEYRRRVR